MVFEVDLVVIGGGPAGLAAAIGARQRGARVVLFERYRPPIDKACGEGLMPDGVRCLSRLGLDPARLEARPFVGITFMDDRRRVDGTFPADPGLGMRRTTLHAAMWDAAERAGVQLEPGTSAACTPDGRVLAGRSAFRARIVAAADGLHSAVRREFGLAREVASRSVRFGVRRHFRVHPWSERVEVMFAPGGEAYITPLGDELVGVALLSTVPDGAPMPPFDEQLAGRFPQLAERLADAEPVGRPRGAGPLRQRVRYVVRDRVALLGDAGGYVDAITGEGISVALHQAAAFVDCLEHGDLEPYVRAHRRIVRLPGLMCRLVLSLAARPALRARALATLARDPRVFDRLLAVHGREIAAHRIGVQPLMRLALGLLRPV